MRVAAVDIGTNTTRLLVADVMADGGSEGTVAWVDRRSVVTRLGEGVDSTKELGEEPMARTVAVLATFGEALRSLRCDSARAIATSATRDAGNRERFLDRAEVVLGVRPEVISGAEEARLSFAGTTGGVAGPGPYLVIDPGGGSTEFVLGTATPEAVTSVDIGSVRLTERELPDRPASPAQLAAARRHVDDLLTSRVERPARVGTAIGVGGTYTSLAAIHRGLAAYDSDLVHGTRLGVTDLHELTDRLATLTLPETEAIPSLDPARAPVLLGGAVVAERALRHVGSGHITVSERDILDGVVLSQVHWESRG